MPHTPQGAPDEPTTQMGRFDRPGLKFVPAGDLAICVELEEEISVAVNTRVRALEFLVQQKGLRGVVETVPSFRSLLVYYDPLVVGYDAPGADLAEPTAR